MCHSWRIQVSLYSEKVTLKITSLEAPMGGKKPHKQRGIFRIMNSLPQNIHIQVLASPLHLAYRTGMVWVAGGTERASHKSELIWKGKGEADMQ